VLALALVLHAAQFAWASVGFGLWTFARPARVSPVQAPEVEGTVAHR
jgi:hypothetical protein